MPRISLALAIAAALSLSACQRADAPTEPPAPAAPTNVSAATPVAASDPAASAPEALEEGGSYEGGIAAEDIAQAASSAPAYGAADQQPNLDALKAAVDHVQQANERLRQAEANKPKAGAATAAPAAPAPSAPTSASSGAALPPARFKVTGDTIVPKAPELANDVFRGMQRVFAGQTGCTTIEGIDTRAVSAQGPFDKNAQGRLISGTIVERWTVSGCGKTAAYHLVMSVRPDSTVDYAIKGA